jgi:hypothetical protein
MEPVVEVTQHKGDSECRPGVLTTDELCGFEKWSGTRIGLPPLANQTYTPLLFVRNALKEGLVQEQLLGVNPFRLGMIGSTDSHNSTPGAVAEDQYQGALGTRDATPALMMAPNAGLGVIGGSESNPGGIAVIWAEENSRDALFDAIRRREVYATSGPRPIVRFFAGDLADVACNGADFVRPRLRDRYADGRRDRPRARRREPALRGARVQGSRAVSARRSSASRSSRAGWTRPGVAQEQVFEVAGGSDERRHGRHGDVRHQRPRLRLAVCRLDRPAVRPHAARVLLRARGREPRLPLEHAALQRAGRRLLGHAARGPRAVLQREPPEDHPGARVDLARLVPAGGDRDGQGGRDLRPRRGGPAPAARRLRDHPRQRRPRHAGVSASR